MSYIFYILYRKDVMYMEFAALDGSNINFTAYNWMIETFEKLNTQRIKEIGKLIILQEQEKCHLKT